MNRLKKIKITTTTKIVGSACVWYGLILVFIVKISWNETKWKKKLAVDCLCVAS